MPTSGRNSRSRNTKVKFDYAVLHKDDMLKEIHPSDAELKAFYDATKPPTTTPFRKNARSVRCARHGQVPGRSHRAREELQSYYDQHRDEYRVPEQVNVATSSLRRLCPAPTAKSIPKGVEEARKKAEDVLKQVKAGGNFEELAKKYSEDPGSGRTAVRSAGSAGAAPSPSSRRPLSRSQRRHQ